MANDSDALAAAMAATDAELFASAMKQDAAVHDDTGDKGLEQQADGLEGAAEDIGDEVETDEPAAEGEEAEAEGEPEAEVKAEGEKAPQPKGPDGKFVKRDEGAEPKQPGVPPARLRETTERARGAEAERDAFKAQNETLQAHIHQLNGKFDLVMRQMELSRQQQQPQKQAEPQPQDLPPDIFVDPDGYRAWSQRQVEQRVAAAQAEAFNRVGELERRVIGQNLAMTREQHGEKFDEAFNAIIQGINAGWPEAALARQRIWTSDNPGGELMRWYRTQTAMREVGGDADAYRKKIADETRAALLADPEFRKEMLSTLKEQAATANGGKPRHVTRLPPSLNGSSGSASLSDNDYTNDSDEDFFNRAVAPRPPAA